MILQRGIDHREVSNHRVRKSLGSETTFQTDISDGDEMIQQLFSLLDEVLESLLQRELFAYTLTLKVKYPDFTQVTRSYTDDRIISDRKKAQALLPALLAKTDANTKNVRLLGISFSNLFNSSEFTDSQFVFVLTCCFFTLSIFDETLLNCI